MNALSYISDHLPCGMVSLRNRKQAEDGSDKEDKSIIDVSCNEELSDYSEKDDNNEDDKISGLLVPSVDRPLKEVMKDAKEYFDDDKEKPKERNDGTGISSYRLINIITDITERVSNSALVSIIFFFPNILFIKPLFFFWFIITLPLTLIERGIKLRNRTKIELSSDSKNKKNKTSATNIFLPKTQNLSSITEEDLVGGDEFILQRDTVKGSLLKAQSNKSSPIFVKHQKLKQENTLADTASVGTNTTFGSKRMGRFLFPKKLIPRSILSSEKKKTLVIDLDETLIHSISRGTTHSNSSQGHIVEVKFSVSGISTLYYVHKRPYCDMFLSKVSKWYNIVIFTASMKEYADPVIDWLETSFPGKFSKRLYRNDCILRDGVGYIKDLNVVSYDSQNKNNQSKLSEIVIIDNSPVSYAMNFDNAIQVEGWISDPTDSDLLNLLPLLESLRYTTDVRNILALKNGEKAFSMS